MLDRVFQNSISIRLIMKIKLLLALAFLCSIGNSNAQEDTDTSTYIEGLLIDSVVITNANFKAEDFIKKVKTDTSFYKAFKTLHLVSYNANNNIKVFDKKGKVKASLQSETKQIYSGGCRTMKVLEEKTTGDFYKKNGDYNYYTAELFASLFLTKGKKCGENNTVAGSLNSRGSGIEKRKNQLKQLMFNPGSRVSGIPGMGNKAAIFDPSVAKMYNFRLSDEDKNNEACYRLEGTPKPEYAKQVVINKFVTWFRKDDYSIVARDYSLSYHTVAYNFDVDIHVDLRQIGKHLLPTYISYRGDWKVVSQDKERVNFSVSFDY